MVDNGVPDIWVTNIPSPTELMGRWRRFMSCCGELGGPGLFIGAKGWDKRCASWDIWGFCEGHGISEYWLDDEDGTGETDWDNWPNISSDEDELDATKSVFVDNMDDKLDMLEETRIFEVEASLESEDKWASEPRADNESTIKTKLFMTKRKTPKILPNFPLGWIWTV